ncbi:MAG TPA: NAD-dependent epimerase/dehydratase family protein [Opitutaceae bacterium]|nr:NAD-dependent epimerase/dehydratase family protein [Opitutaceae bacterium]
MIQRTVVSGASGFLGRALCRAIAERGDEVTGIARGSKPPDDLCVDWISMDIVEETPLLQDGITTFFHLAGKAHAISERTSNDAEYERVNVTGTQRALDAAAAGGARAFVFFSSVKVFGDHQQRGDRALVEEDAPEPDTPYGRSKLAAERLVLDDKRIPHRVVVRPALVYGPRVKGNLARMRDAVARGRFPPIRETGNRRSLVYVGDLVRAALLAASVPDAAGRIYHIADGEAYSTRRLYLAMCVAAGRAPASWTMPHALLRALALAGDAAGAIRGRRAPFDTAALRRLNESAWFGADRARRELAWKPLNTVETWCTSVGAE